MPLPFTSLRSMLLLSAAASAAGIGMTLAAAHGFGPGSGGAVVCCLAACALSLVTARRLASRTAKLSSDIRALEGDSLYSPLAGTAAQDEIGDIARACDRFRASTIERVADAQSDMKRNAAMARERERIGDLSRRLKGTINQVLGAIQNLSTTVGMSTQQFTYTAGRTHDDLATAVTSLNTASADVESVSRGMGEVSASIAEIADQARASAELTARATGEIDHAHSVAEALREAVNRIADAS
ncbi:MAG: hypothetical protein ACXU8O_08410, partial [Asticcacaulis sp.]